MTKIPEPWRMRLNRQLENQCHNPQHVQKLLHSGADVNYQDEYGTTVLMNACSYGYLETVEILLAHGADPNLCGMMHPSIGMTALMRAASGKEPEIVRQLLNAGALVNVREDSDDTALHYASANVNLEIVQMLVEAGAQVNARGTNGATALDYANTRMDADVIAFLKSRGAVATREDGAFMRHVN